MIKLRNIVLIHDLKRQGLSVSAIARATGFDRKTIRKYLDRGLETPVYGPRDPRPRLLDPYEDYLREKVQACPGLSGRRLLREITALGYTGGYSAVTDFCARFARRLSRRMSGAMRRYLVNRHRWILPSSASCSQMSQLCGARYGCSASFWGVHAGFGVGSVRTRNLKR